MPTGSDDPYHHVVLQLKPPTCLLYQSICATILRWLLGCRYCCRRLSVLMLFAVVCYLGRELLWFMNRHCSLRSLPNTRPRVPFREPAWRCSWKLETSVFGICNSQQDIIIINACSCTPNILSYIEYAYLLTYKHKIGAIQTTQYTLIQNIKSYWG
jgi:hypothetical protein